MLGQTITELRAATPGTSGHVHLNSAGASLMPESVLKAMIDHLRLESELGGYEAAAQNADKAQRLYQSLAELLGCDPEELAFADSASRAWNAILYSIELDSRDAVVTTQAEFGSNIVSLVQHCQRTGAELRVVRCTPSGTLDLDDLDRKWDDRVRLVAATHVAAHRGYQVPVAELAKRAAASGAFFLLDSAQAVGQIELNVRELQCHALVGTGRKWLRGPRGTAFVYVSRDLPFQVTPSFCDLASADFVGQMDGPRSIEFRKNARQFELWERSIASAIGLGVAVDYLLQLGPEDAYARIAELGRYLTTAISDTHGRIEVLTDPNTQTGIVGLAFDELGVSPATVKARLAESNISVSTMSAYDAPWDYAALGRSSILRVAPHYFNETAELDLFVDRLLKAVS